MTKQTEFKLFRTGIFAVNPHKNDDSQCGKTGECQYKYEVVLYAPFNQLKQDGFVIDIQVIKDYFTHYSTNNPTVKSCELIGMQTIAYLANYCKQRNVQPNKIKVKIWGTDYQYVETIMNV